MMRSFHYDQLVQTLLTPEIVNLLTSIHEYKGKQGLYLDAKADTLSSMLEIAKIQSTEASNRIEGIYTSDARLQMIVRHESAPQTRNEQEIAGYRDVLSTIHENFDYILPRPNIILQLHRDLYRYSGFSIGGRFKNSDNIIEEIDAQGKSSVRFRPLSAFETPDVMDRLCDEWARAADNEQIDPLLLIPVFILDFLCIHPFNDGNGRLSRLLTLLLLYRSGYIVGKYISMETIIEKTKVSYYDSLQASSIGWGENENDCHPFVSYYLGVILSAYRDFAQRVEYIAAKKMTAPQRIEDILKNKVGRLNKKEISVICPDLHIGTIERALGELVKEGKIKMVGSGRGTAYMYDHKIT